MLWGKDHVGGSPTPPQHTILLWCCMMCPYYKIRLTEIALSYIVISERQPEQSCQSLYLNCNLNYYGRKILMSTTYRKKNLILLFIDWIRKNMRGENQLRVEWKVERSNQKAIQIFNEHCSLWSTYELKWITQILTFYRDKLYKVRFKQQKHLLGPIP